VCSSDLCAEHADHIFMGPGEDTWPQFLDDLKHGTALRRYASRERSLAALPPIRRDLIKRHLYLVPNSIVVSRGCPHVCDFCYKVAFFQGGKQFYTMEVDSALAEIDRLRGVISISSTTTSLAIRASRRRCSTGWRVWGASGKQRGP